MGDAMRQINRLLIHMAYTPPSMDIGVAEIRDWHLQRGWRDVGYHFVIRRDGTVEDGRPLHQEGAHARGENADSIGICLIGGKHASRDGADANFTAAQWRALDRLCRDLLLQHPGAQISGHRDWLPTKCPGFDAVEWGRALQ